MGSFIIDDDMPLGSVMQIQTINETLGKPRRYWVIDLMWRPRMVHWTRMFASLRALYDCISC